MTNSRIIVDMLPRTGKQCPFASEYRYCNNIMMCCTLGDMVDVECAIDCHQDSTACPWLKSISGD